MHCKSNMSEHAELICLDRQHRHGWAVSEDRLHCEEHRSHARWWFAPLSSVLVPSRSHRNLHLDHGEWLGPVRRRSLVRRHPNLLQRPRRYRCTSQMRKISVLVVRRRESRSVSPQLGFGEGRDLHGKPERSELGTMTGTRVRDKIVTGIAPHPLCRSDTFDGESQARVFYKISS
jgi:hypothetical protein